MPYHALHDMHVYLHTPTVVFKARVNMASVTYPATTLTFDTVTVGAFGDIQVDSTLLLGTTDGGDELGRVRVQNVATSTTIPIGRISQGTEDGTLNIADNAYITVWNDFRVWAKIPFSNTDTGVDYKDSDVAVGNYLTTAMPPVANCGVGFAAYINSVTSLITVAFDGTGSFAMATGATISTYAWDLQGGTVTVGTLTSSTLTATFPAGFRWVVLTVTDSNGTSHTTRCPVLAVNPAADVTIPFVIEGWEKVKEGQTFSFRLLDNRLRTTYPDGCLVLFWWDAPLSPADRSHMQFIGWHQSDSFSIRATPQGNIIGTILNCVDVAGRLAALPAFPQALQRTDDDDVDEMWSLMPTLNMRKCLHYLIFWHSTAAGLADLFLPISLADYPSMRLDSTGASLYEQINSRAQSIVPDHWFVCNAKGQLSVVADWMLLDFAARPTIVASLSEDYWASMEVTYQRPPKVYVLNSGAVVSSTDWLMLGGEKTLPLAFCKAPGTAFGQGVSEATTGEKLTISQAALNACEGHRYARLNARYGLFSITEPSGTIAGDADALEPAAMLPIEVAISAATAAQRGLDFTVTRGMVKRISMRANTTPQGTWFAPTIQFEKEVIGLPAVTHTPEVPEDPDYEVPEPPPATDVPDFGLIGGQQLLAGIGSDGYRYKTTDFQTVSGSGGPTYTRDNLSIAATIYSFVVDPFSPGYAPGATSGAVNGWIANDTDIYRVTDLHGTTVAASVHTFPVATVGASFHWRSIQASFGAYFAEGVNPWLMCVSYYGSTAGHTGTWATYSTDGGVTWSAEVQISAHYNTTAATRFNPIAVFTSPRTPGFALTAAYSETAADAQAYGYVTTNWGATWAAYTAIDSGSGQAGSIHLPWPDNAAENILYHGQLITTVEEGTAAELMPAWAKYENETATLTQLADGVEASIVAHAEVFDGGGDSTGNLFLMYGPPPDAVRVNSTVIWSAYRSSDGGFGSQSLNLDGWPHSGITRTSGSSNYTDPAANSSSSGSFSVVHERNFSTDPWPINNTNLDVAAWSSTNRVQYSVFASLASVQGGHHWVTHVEFTWVITEIELEDSTIYTPTMPTGARGFRLKRVISGASADVSPDDGGILFGINDFGFTVRSFDNDRQFMAVAGIGNDTSGVIADDLVGLWVSSNAGTAWVNILAPVAASNAPRGLQIAFGSSSSDILFAWGGISNGALPAIWYSSNGGTLLDSREGNINSLGTTTIIGIAGGPNG